MTQLSPEFIRELEEIGEDINAVVDSVLIDTGTNDVFTNQVVKNLIFYGKSLSAWEDLLSLEIPSGKIDQDILRELYVQLANKIQIASHYYCMSMASTTVASTGVTIKKTDLITSLLTYYNANGLKTPPNTILDRMAESYTMKLNNLVTLSKVVKDFWKEKLNTLEKVKSCLSSISISVATELKYLGEG